MQDPGELPAWIVDCRDNWFRYMITEHVAFNTFPRDKAKTICKESFENHLAVFGNPGEKFSNKTLEELWMKSRDAVDLEVMGTEKFYLIDWNFTPVSWSSIKCTLCDDEFHADSRLFWFDPLSCRALCTACSPPYCHPTKTETTIEYPCKTKLNTYELEPLPEPALPNPKPEEFYDAPDWSRDRQLAWYRFLVTKHIVYNLFSLDSLAEWWPDFVQRFPDLSSSDIARHHVTLGDLWENFWLGIYLHTSVKKTKYFLIREPRTHPQWGRVSCAGCFRECRSTYDEDGIKKEHDLTQPFWFAPENSTAYCIACYSGEKYPIIEYEPAELKRQVKRYLPKPENDAPKPQEMPELVSIPEAQIQPALPDWAVKYPYDWYDYLITEHIAWSTLSIQQAEEVCDLLMTKNSPKAILLPEKEIRQFGKPLGQVWDDFDEASPFEIWKPATESYSRLSLYCVRIVGHLRIRHLCNNCLDYIEKGEGDPSLSRYDTMWRSPRGFVICNKCFDTDPMVIIESPCKAKILALEQGSSTYLC